MSTSPLPPADRPPNPIPLSESVRVIRLRTRIGVIADALQRALDGIGEYTINLGYVEKQLGIAHANALEAKAIVVLWPRNEFCFDDDEDGTPPAAPDHDLADDFNREVFGNGKAGA